MADWTVAFDDGLTQRLQCCTLCGRREGISLWGVCSAATLMLAYVLCHRCEGRDGARAVERLFTQRYEAGVRTDGPS